MRSQRWRKRRRADLLYKYILHTVYIASLSSLLHKITCSQWLALTLDKKKMKKCSKRIISLTSMAAASWVAKIVYHTVEISLLNCLIIVSISNIERRREERKEERKIYWNSMNLVFSTYRWTNSRLDEKKHINNSQLVIALL